MTRSTLLLWLLLTALPALADGSHIVLHAISGSTTVTVFTAADSLTPGPAEFSILVQDAATNATLADASVAAHLAGPDLAQSLALAPAAGLLIARVVLPRPGAYRLSLSVTAHGAPQADFAANLDVQPETDRRTTVLISVLVPLAIIVLFLWNRQLKARRRRPI